MLFITLCRLSDRARHYQQAQPSRAAPRRNEKLADVSLQLLSCLHRHNMQKDRRFVGGVQAQVWKTNQLLLSLEDLVLKKANYFQQPSQETSLRVKLQHLISDVDHFHAAVHRVLAVQFSHVLVASCSVFLASGYSCKDLQPSIPLYQSCSG